MPFQNSLFESVKRCGLADACGRAGWRSVALVCLCVSTARAEVGVAGTEATAEATEPSAETPVAADEATAQLAPDSQKLRDQNAAASSPEQRPREQTPAGPPPAPIPRTGHGVTPVASTLAPGADAPAEEVTFHERFATARTALLDNRDEEAMVLFEALIHLAPTPEDRRVAEEFATLARERVAMRERDVPAPHIRTTDELSVLYTTAFSYGFGTSAWFALQVKPGSFATAILPFIAITTASVGAVAIIDDNSPFRLGVPQSIAAGTILGTIEGVWLSAYQQAVAARRDTDRWGAPTVSTFLWAGATAGGIAGGLIGAAREPTPGQVSYTTSGALWGGIAAALIAGASESQQTYRAERAFAIGALGYNAGLIAALLTSPYQAPSVARIRLVDLGGLAGGLLGAGSYLLAAEDKATSRASLGAAAGGALVGLALSWWATDGMQEHRRPDSEPLLSRLRPSVLPVRQGAIGVLELTL